MPSALAQLVEQRVVALGLDDDGAERVVLGGRADHRRAADVDVLDDLALVGAGPRRGALERIEVDAHEVDELDVVFGGRAHVLGVVADGEQAGVELGMQRLDAPVHDLREAGEVLDRAHREAGALAARAPCRPVETTSTPSSARPRAKSTIPRLSETDSSARRMRTAPGSVSGSRAPVEECSAMAEHRGAARGQCARAVRAHARWEHRATEGEHEEAWNAGRATPSRTSSAPATSSRSASTSSTTASTTPARRRRRAPRTPTPARTSWDDGEEEGSTGGDPAGFDDPESVDEDDDE